MNEGSACTCASAGEHFELVRRVDRSFEQDAARAKLSQQVATSQALNRRAAAPRNGHT